MADRFTTLRLVTLVTVGTMALATSAQAGSFVGAVYAGTNDPQGNGLVAYGSDSNGTPTFIGEFSSGGAGARLNAGGSVDPLISSHSVLNIGDRFILEVTAGSNTVSSFRVNPDFSLTLASTVPSGGFGPDAIAEHDGVVYPSRPIQQEIRI